MFLFNVVFGFLGCETASRSTTVDGVRRRLSPLVSCQSWMLGFVLGVRNVRAFDGRRKLSVGLAVERRPIFPLYIPSGKVLGYRTSFPADADF